MTKVKLFIASLILTVGMLLSTDVKAATSTLSVTPSGTIVNANQTITFPRDVVILGNLTSSGGGTSNYTNLLNLPNGFVLTISTNSNLILNLQSNVLITNVTTGVIITNQYYSLDFTNRTPWQSYTTSNILVNFSPLTPVQLYSINSANAVFSFAGSNGSVSYQCSNTAIQFPVGIHWLTSTNLGFITNGVISFTSYGGTNNIEAALKENVY